MPDMQQAGSLASRPESTYRLQFHAKFTFRDATDIVAYLSQLGITHVYASPYLKARPGSTHGYDVIDHCTLNPELGSPQDYQRWIDELRRYRMSHILDTVPNHVGVGTNDNVWWNDVLENGPASKYEDYFDINWTSANRSALRGKVLLPLLGEPYEQALEQGKLKLICQDGKLAVQYYDRRVPISPASYQAISSANELEQVASRFNGQVGKPASFDRLDALLGKQHYRLAYWKVAPNEINYRRFFDINDLAALKMERADVFQATHKFILQLLAEGKIAGLRIDHPDGLYDPAEYLQRLQSAYASARGLSESTAQDKALYITVEKILASGESLPIQWPVDGTTGYDFLNQINGWFIDANNCPAFDQIYQQWTGERTPFADVAYQKKLLILDRSLSSELHMLARQLDDLAQSRHPSRDFTLSGLREVLRQVIACFPVYRSYIADGQVGAADRRYIEEAIGQAKRRSPDTVPQEFDFLHDMLLLNYPQRASEADKEAQRRFVGKFQQLTAPVTAKGIEDTAFYCYHRFISLCEVGGDPDRFGVTSAELHDYLQDRQVHWPHALSALSTHDTKRSEDVRARLNVLSEIPERWSDSVKKWGQLNQGHKQTVDGHAAPDRNEEYLLYQTMLGIWPIDGENPGEEFIRRISEYALKALRESKVHTSWTDPNDPYEKAVQQFIAAILDEAKSSVFLKDFASLAQWIGRHGMRNSLAQTLLRLTCPGVPDTCQGSELWDWSLVDPDNRRPVEYAMRRRLLEEVIPVVEKLRDCRRSIMEWSQNLGDGKLKLHLTALGLRYRRDHRGLFSSGEYRPLQVIGSKSQHVLAFQREHKGDSAMIIVPRLTVQWAQGSTPLGLESSAWEDTRVSFTGEKSQPLIDLLTGTRVTPTADGGISLANLPDFLPGWLLISTDALG